MKGVIWCPPKKKEKKETCPAALRINFGWVGMRARPFLFACREPVVSSGHPAGLLSLSLSRSCSFSSASLALAGAGWSSAAFWELMRKEERTETRFLLFSTLEQLCRAFHKLSCVVCEAQKKKKRRKKQTNNQKKNALRLIAIAVFSSSSSSSLLFQLLPERDRVRQSTTPRETQRERERERERENTVQSFLL
jgi:hypothetical protein